MFDSLALMCSSPIFNCLLKYFSILPPNMCAVINGQLVTKYRERIYNCTLCFSLAYVAGQRPNSPIPPCFSSFE